MSKAQLIISKYLQFRLAQIANEYRNIKILR